MFICSSAFRGLGQWLKLLRPSKPVPQSGSRPKVRRSAPFIGKVAMEPSRSAIPEPERWSNTSQIRSAIIGGELFRRNFVPSLIVTTFRMTNATAGIDHLCRPFRASLISPRQPSPAGWAEGSRAVGASDSAGAASCPIRRSVSLGLIAYRPSTPQPCGLG